MAYEKHLWVAKEKVTAEKLNHIEEGIAAGGQSSASGTVTIILAYDSSLERVVPKVTPVTTDTAAIADYYIKLRDDYYQLENAQAPSVRLYESYGGVIFYPSRICWPAEYDPDSVIIAFNDLFSNPDKYVRFYKNGNVELAEDF